MENQQGKSQRKPKAGSGRVSSEKENQQQPSGQTTSSGPHFASSVFLNSPDPSKLPLPDFADDDNGVEDQSSRLISAGESSLSPVPGEKLLPLSSAKQPKKRRHPKSTGKKQ
jgi:hypothetical protein